MISERGICILICGWTLACAALAATVRDGPAATRIGTLQDDRINEASGIVASRQHDGVFWTHNDGDDGVLYAIRRDGSAIASVKIDAKIRDWEDITTDDAGNLYVADVGNNSQNRKHVIIYRVREPDPRKLDAEKSAKLDIEETWKVDFPDEPANVESLIIRDGHGYLVFKRPEGLPAEVYRIDLKQHKKARMTRLATIPVDRPVTSASLSRDKNYLAVLVRDQLWVFSVQGDIANVSNAEATRFPIPPVQAEGCTFGYQELLIVAESREVFSIPFEHPSTRPSGSSAN